ncbi:mechanosensitive ion channel [Altererythrobacter xixiisoli]|uniref:Small-conductance mechanosensitive channel n=1 Tax=Croceibacterium xixiisoli TaxID=1476466 RepID=A0A6I4TVL7_9SPHN|nr:mechanosensitive ion channel [Croceibacterium xixiisoli]MXO98638.1 mechanosensitive ion channel [Croceibacterium xixiisoli]
MDYLTILRNQVVGMTEAMIASLPNLVIAAVVLVLTWGVAKLASRIAKRFIGHTHMREALKQLIRTLIRLFIWIFGLLIAATIAVPGFTPAGLIAGLGVGALAVGFAFQDIFQNFLAGVLIMLRDKMRIGDNVEADGVSGKVERVTLRETHIRQFSGELTILPNATIFKGNTKILTDQPQRRDDMTLLINDDCDLRLAEETMRKTLKSAKGVVVDGRTQDVYAQAFETGSVRFVLRWWVDTSHDDMQRVKADVIYAIKDALEEAGVELNDGSVTYAYKEGAEPPPFPREQADADQ